MWSGLVEVMKDLATSNLWEGQIERLRRWYDPMLELLYDAARVRRGDLDQLERMALQHASRASFLTDLTLDPPEASGDEAGPPVKDEDWLVLSTIHSAKGQEWRAVVVLNVVDGCIPSDLATGTAAEIEEERRLLYVAMTRARDDLVLMQPLRFYVRGQALGADRHVYAPRSRFIADADLDGFERVGHAGALARAGRRDVRAHRRERRPHGEDASDVEVGVRGAGYRRRQPFPDRRFAERLDPIGSLRVKRCRFSLTLGISEQEYPSRDLRDFDRVRGEIRTT